MFSDNKKNKNPQEALLSQNIIAKGSSIVGDLISEGDIRIDGSVEGNVKTSGKVVVGKDGKITGSLESKEAYFEGAFSGKLTVSEMLTLKSSAQIEGEVTLNKLTVDPGAIFNVNCNMTGRVKNIKSGKNSEKSA